MHRALGFAFLEAILRDDGSSRVLPLDFPADEWGDEKFLSREAARKLLSFSSVASKISPRDLNKLQDFRGLQAEYIHTSIHYRRGIITAQIISSAAHSSSENAISCATA